MYTLYYKSGGRNVDLKQSRQGQKVNLKRMAMIWRRGCGSYGDICSATRETQLKIALRSATGNAVVR